MINILFFMMILCSISIKHKSSIRTEQAKKLSNTDYLFRGYDIFFGDLTPRDGEIDPGFKAPIFRSTFLEGETTSDLRYDIPDGYNLVRVEGCSLSMTNTVITGESSYQNTFGIEVGVEGTIKGVKFGASTSFKNVNEEISKNKKAYIYSKADCKVYMGEMDVYDPPKFHKSFLGAVKLLNSRKTTFNEKPSLYWNFIKNFGTHYINQVKMGARFGAMSKISQSELSRMQSNKISFDASIGIKDILNFKSNISNENVQSSKIMAEMEEVKVFTIGSKPNSNLDPKAWAANVIDEPMPISYKIRPLIEVFQDDELFFDLNQFEGVDINFIKSNLKEAFDNYCEKYLLVEKLVRSCVDVQRDSELQQYVKEQINTQQYYYLENMETKTCFTYPNQNTQDVFSLPCGVANPLKLQGIFFDFSNSTWKITMRGYEGCLDLFNGNNDDNGRIVRWDCDRNSSNQYFTVLENDNGSYTFKTKHNKCLQVLDDNRANYAKIVSSNCNGSPGQKWLPRRVTNVNLMDNGLYKESTK